MVTALDKQLTAFREGAGDDVEILLDLNFNFKTEGCLRIAKILEKYELLWLEIDMYDPEDIPEYGSYQDDLNGKAPFYWSDPHHALTDEHGTVLIITDKTLLARPNCLNEGAYSLNYEFSSKRPRL